MKKLTVFLATVFSAFILGNRVDAQPACQAGFQYQINPNGVVQFYDSSFAANPPLTYQWDFGDGTTSTLANPSHAYNFTFIGFGVNVCLTITDTSGCTDTYCDSVTASTNSGGGCIDQTLIDPNIFCPQVYAPVCGCDGVTYGNSCEATYRGGVTSWTQGPCGSTTGCQASFTAQSDSLGVQFWGSNNNLLSTTYSWNFGDGDSSNQANPYHAYANAGVYYVCLTIQAQTTPMGPVCTDTYCDSVLFNPNMTGSGGCVDSTLIDTTAICPAIYAPVCGCDGNTYSNACEAEHLGGVTSYTQGACNNTGSCQAFWLLNVSGLAVQFTDASFAIGQASSWNWDFGDGNTSTLQNPTHIYSTPGVYGVCLTVAATSASGNITCTDAYCDSILVDTVGSRPCNAYFWFNPTPAGGFAFVNQSTGTTNTTSYFWDFGDGTTSSAFAPVHNYNVTGTYLVCLTISDNAGCSSAYCDTLLYQGGNNTNYYVSGNIFKGPNTVGNRSLADHAVVYLVQFDSTNLLSIFAVDSVELTPSDSGYYSFTNVPQGIYLVKAALRPADNDYSSFLPTYYNNVLFWYNSWPVFVGPGMPFISHDINLIPGTNPGGPGFVGGSVVQGANKMLGPGDPIAGVQVMVLDMNDNPIQYTYSDANGKYSFSNLAYGTYQIYAEIAGKNTDPAIVTISADNEAVADVMIHVKATEIISGISDEISNPLSSSIRIYPTIADKWVKVDFSLEKATDMTFGIRNLLGQKLVSLQQKGIAGAQSVKLDVADLEAGVYLLTIRVGNEQVSSKLIKY